MSDDHKREQVEWVFGLTGGELADGPWIAGDPEVKTQPLYREDGTIDWNAPSHLDLEVFRYWYEGVPDYMESDYPDKFDATYITAVIDCLFGEPPDVLHNAQGVWRKKQVLVNSGETECPCNEDEDFSLSTCPLCERDHTDEDDEDTSYIYLGDGWCEVIYRKDEPTHRYTLVLPGKTMVYHATEDERAVRVFKRWTRRFWKRGLPNGNLAHLDATNGLARATVYLQECTGVPGVFDAKEQYVDQWWLEQEDDDG